MSRSRAVVTLAVLLGLGSMGHAVAQSEIADFTPVTDEMLANPADGDWLSWRRTLDHQGYSPLDQINTENVGQLQLAWARAIEPGAQEAGPLVYDGIMFLPSPNSIVQALDATDGTLIWEYRRQLPEDLAEYVAGLDRFRSIGIWEDEVIISTPDGYLVSLDARTGAMVWETQVADYRDRYWQRSGPIIANGKAISGRSCWPTSGPEACFLVAHDLSTGEELWRTFMIPRAGEEGDDTWSNIPYESRWHVGSWITPSYDPDLNLVYFGTSVTSPYSKFILGAEDQDAEFLYQTSTLALDADTGEIIWYQQHIRDQWDLDHPFERILVDTAIAPNADEVAWINPAVTPGEERRVLTGIPGKTGIFYSIDRETGEFLWARETVEQNVILDIDATGRATMNSDLFFTEAGQVQFVCPSALGGKNWPVGAYSPLTNAIYYPLQNTCMEAMALGDEPIAEELGQVDLPTAIAPGTDMMGTLRGISVETGEELWLYEQRAAMLSVTTTGGGLIFGGDVNQRFRAFDQQTGDILWETILGGPVGGFPVSYEADGRQYIAVSAGGLPPAIGGYLLATPELRPSTNANHLFVFALPRSE